MSLRVINSFLICVFYLMLASCAVVDERAQEYERPDQAVGIQKFPAWADEALATGSAGKNQAIQTLLEQADTLIDKNEMEQASDKLERLLRIEPSYAQAWSRLAWIALENKKPARTRQMAQRSNSYAYNNNKLKALNWSFIREANFQTGDEEAIRHAETMIESLDDSMGGF